MNAPSLINLARVLAFSFAHAIQQSVLEIWHGKEANVRTAQQALIHTARCNCAAHRGEHTAAMERT
jgi:fructose-bisphosphate aldolase class I